MELLDFSFQQTQNRQSCSLFKEIVLSRATQRRFIEEVISVTLITIAFHGKITIFTVEIGIVARCSGSGSSQRTFRFNFAFPLSLWFGRLLLSNILLDHEKTGDFTDCWSFIKLYRFFFLRVLDFQSFKITRCVKICYTLKRISITAIHPFRF